MNTAFVAEKFYYRSNDYRCLDKDMIMNARVVLAEQSVLVGLLMTNKKTDRSNLAEV